ncbi:hypothetical protein HMPREF3156_02810 [Neisseria sp. HMSC06F02]|nr:hypothetical protein HMPREF3156_02810 [Neisseria sp. HMSC06F02]
MEDAFEFGELEFVVHAGGKVGGAHLDGMDFDAVGNGFGDEVGQVVFALGVVAGEAVQPVFQFGVGQDEDACVDFADGFLGGVGVFFFDDGGYAALAVADDAAQACRVGGNVGQQADFAAGGFEQGFEGGGVNQGNVAVQHQRAAFGGKVRQGGFDGVAGAELFGLFDPNDVAFDGVQNLVFAVSDDDADVLGIQGGGGVDNALDHGLAADSVQHFGHFGIHARAFAGGEDDDVEGCGGHDGLSRMQC